MPGVAPLIRPLVAPYVIAGGAQAHLARLSVLHGKPLTTRRYMWKGGY